MAHPLTADLAGDVLLPHDPGYDAARSVFNAMIDRRPLAILRCHGPADVARGIAYAREHDLVLSVRGGGHNVAGNAVCDGGIMLDLSPLKALDVDVAGRTARAGAGLLLGEFDRGTQQHGLATPAGVMSGTGLAGLTLGGGLGWLNGRYGLTCDNLLGAEVVTADGRILHVGPDAHEDLLWGLRGGGGNFGVVISFTYRLHPVGRVLAGQLTYAWPDAAAALRFHDGFLRAAPDELTSALSLARGADGVPRLGIVVCWCGDPAEGERVLRPLRAFGPPATDTIDVMPYADLQRLPDAGFPDGRLHHWKSGYLRPLRRRDRGPAAGGPADAVGGERDRAAVHARGRGTRRPRRHRFAHRAEQYDVLVLAQWEDPRESDRNIAWAREAYEALRPNLADAVYVNNLGVEGAGRVQAAYGTNLGRLTALKRVYDPENVFRMNQNVAPA